MMIGTIDNSDIDRCMSELFGGFEPSEAASNNDDFHASHYIKRSFKNASFRLFNMYGIYRNIFFDHKQLFLLA